jgi:hypothetical protein
MENGVGEMLILEGTARECFRKKYGKRLPEDFYAIDCIWNEAEFFLKCEF